MDTLTNYGFEVRQENQQYFLFIDNKKITEVSYRFSITNEPLLINENNDFIFNISLNKVNKLLTINSKTLKYSLKENILEFLKINIEDGIDSYSNFFAVLYENGDSEVINVFDDMKNVFDLKSIITLSDINSISLLENNIFSFKNNSGNITLVTDKGIPQSVNKYDYLIKAEQMAKHNFTCSSKLDFSKDLYYLSTNTEDEVFFNSKTMIFFELKKDSFYHFFVYAGKNVIREYNKETKFTLFDSEFNILIDNCLILSNTEEHLIYQEINNQNGKVYDINGTFLFEEKGLYSVNKIELQDNFVYLFLYSGHKMRIKTPDFKQETIYFYFSDGFKQKWSSKIVEKGCFEQFDSFIFRQKNSLILPAKEDLALWHIQYKDDFLFCLDLNKPTNDNFIHLLFAGEKVTSATARDYILKLRNLIIKSFVRFEVLKEIAVTITNFGGLSTLNEERRNFFDTVLKTQILTDAQQKEIMKALEYKKRTSSFDKKSISRITVTTRKTAKKVNISNEDLVDYSNLFNLWK